ncbi:MAG: hypothetical protein P4L57_06595 [Rhizomicrobium sp.]|nr:hypothetical protein [Rhizomicrobium sp.]
MRTFLDRLYNFHWLCEGDAARSSQAFFGGLELLLRRHGLKAIVNLRGENADLSWWRYERAVCARLGARHIDAMMDSRHLPTRAMLTTLLDAFETAPRPFLLKCSGGHDRTALAAALFIIARDGWRALESAEQQFDAAIYGHKPKRYQHWLKPFLRFAAEDAKGVKLSDWIRDCYDPNLFAAWLEDHDLNESHKGIFTKPTRSPFQL